MPARPFADVTAGDIMHANPIVVGPEQSLAELRHLLIQSQISGAPVVSQGQLVGIVSRSDLVRIEEMLETLDEQVGDRETWLDNQADGFQHPLPQGFGGFRRALERMHVKDAMRVQVVTCKTTTPVAEVADEMVRQHVHRVVVVDGDGHKPVGIVSTLDIAALVAGRARTK
ncbi:MAG TPA: CBS domain-containing protein [Pirellulales bacterium]|jgi:CBS domain-containing protein|nr:CBS domain-containing protein [Pirellulales bacterium]